MLNEITKTDPSIIRVESFIKEKTYAYKRYDCDPVETASYKPKQAIKAIIISSKKPDQEKVFVMLTLPVAKKVDNKKLKKEMGYSNFRLANDGEITKLTINMTSGGIPPIGSLFGIETLCDQSILSENEVIFSAGNNKTFIIMPTQEYITCVAPKIISFT